jgi:hypothetical protein
MKASGKRRSPLQFSPLRIPGQSLTDEIDDVSYDGFLSPLLLALVTIVLAGLEWWRYETNLKPSPWTFTVVAFLAAVYAAVRCVRTFRHLRNLKLGRDGERAVAQYLEWFRTAEFFVLHDVPNDDANIDHVLIGPRGVFTIETKTVSKPARGECRIRVENQQVLVNGHVMDRDPLRQAKAQAGWLSNFLAQARFKAYVQPVVVFPGWFVEPFDMKAAGVWVLEPKGLDKFIGREPEHYSREEVKAMASALSSHVRSKANL